MIRKQTRGVGLVLKIVLRIDYNFNYLKAQLFGYHATSFASKRSFEFETIGVAN